ncbi:DUF3857 domain-containing protein [Flavobacterium sp. N3904]|uniref:DUF3857 domain-containing protein n=1 Tax=Flavobacterium sp. N3904 TaxID=2986835 RepID=UPI0022253A09|nr:DUF3857 domain-containing protein [Flavobacterium sp. N3904]
MKKYKVVVGLLLIVLSINVHAQEFKLGKVTIAELQQKQHPKDTSAVAAILFEKGSVHYEDLVTITTVKTKIKIYKKDGFNWANKEVAHYLQGERVAFSDAITYNLVDGKIEKTKLKSEGEFETKINKYFGQKKIAMPNVKEGSIIEFEYTIRSENFGSLRDWYFQTSIPVNYTEYKVKTPKFLTFNKRSKGFIYPRLSSEPTYNQETSTVFTLENVPALKEETLVNNIDNYKASVSYELALVNIPGYAYKEFATDWNAVVKTIFEYDDFGPELNKTGYFEDDLKAVIAGLSKQDDIIVAVLNYVKSTVKWNDYKGYSCNDGVKQAYKDKTGNVAEINLMLTAMLRTSGLKANPVLLSTRDNGITLFPSSTAFNYVIAAVETPEGLILLDATSKFSTPNVLPFEDLNWFGRLIRKDGTSEEVDLMPKKASNDNITMNYAIDATGKITGKLRRQRTDHNAMKFRLEVENVKEDDYLEKLENENEKIEIADYRRTNEKDVQLPVTETCSFSGTNLCEIIGEKMYISPLLFFTKEHNPFKQETREYPVDYGFPFIDKYTINIDIPEGYVVELLPKSAQFNMEDDLGSFKFLSNAAGNKIQFSVSHQINTPIVSAEYYSMLKEYYQGMIAKETEKIILKKV